MELTSRSGGRLIAVLVGMQVLVLTGSADSEDRFRAGMKDFTVSGGYWVDHNTGGFRDSEFVDGFQFIPHFGYFLTDTHGTGWLRGNLELLAEPTLIHLDARDSATVAGLSALGRWVFTGWSVARPYVEVGVGVLGGHVNLRQTNCNVNFSIQGGPGMMLFVSQSTAVTVGYRFQHLSNANLCSKNIGLNSSQFILGFSYFFP